MRTEAVELENVPVDLKVRPKGQEPLQLPQLALAELHHPAAAGAVEVMVARAFVEFIPAAAIVKIHMAEEPFSGEEFQIPVDGGGVGFHPLLPEDTEDVLGREVILGRPEDLQDSPAPRGEPYPLLFEPFFLPVQPPHLP